MKPLNAAVLIQKVKKNLRNEEFLSVRLAKAQNFDVAITLPAKIVAASEIGFRLVSSIRLDCQSQVAVTSTFINELKIQEYALRSGPVLAKAVEQGQYNNEIRLPGVSREISSRIRKLMMTWK